MDEVEAKQLLEYIPQKERDSYDAADFAGPDRSFPITSQAQLDAAAHLIGHAADPAAVKRKAIAIARRKGFTLPDAWQKEDGDGDNDGDDGDGKTQESAASVVQAQSKPRKKIATLKVCFLEYNARSLNGRIYPKATCDAIYQSGVRKLADSNALPMTCFVSHEAANGNANTELVGAVRGLSQEGSKFYANIDLADTRIAWDQLALVEGGYMRSESMRVLGVDLRHDRNYDLPLVVPQETAEQVELMGIDLTTRPGLIDSARILQTLYESQSPALYESEVPRLYTETFTIDNVLIEQKEEAPMSQLPLYLKVILEEGLTPDRQAHQRIHDHLAGVLDVTVKPVHGSESARFIAAVESELSEEGRAIARQHAVRLAQAHDEAARQLGMDCESGYHGTLGIALDPDQDGTPDQSNQDTGDEEDDGESHRSEGEKIMTEQEMMEALKAKGFAIEAPKTDEQKMQEAINAAIAEAERKFNEKLAALTAESNNNNDTQRKTQATSAMNESNNNDLVEEDLYQEGDYLAGKLHPKNWKALANPKVPWPQDVDPALALHELAPLIVHRMLSVEAEARGIEVGALVGQYEQL